MGLARFGMVAAALLALSPSPGTARADAAAPVELPTFDPIFQNDAAVRAVVARIGLPDRAEVVPLDVGSPWEGYELRAYYLGSDQMFVFMRASPAHGDVSILMYQGPIPPVAPEPVPVSAASTLDPDRAAAEAEARADEAERAADRAEAATAALEESFKKSLVKK
jgi:hypothetical protein